MRERRQQRTPWNTSASIVKWDAENIENKCKHVQIVVLLFVIISFLCKFVFVSRDEFQNSSHAQFYLPNYVFAPCPLYHSTCDCPKLPSNQMDIKRNDCYGWIWKRRSDVIMDFSKIQLRYTSYTLTHGLSALQLYQITDATNGQDRKSSIFSFSVWGLHWKTKCRDIYSITRVVSELNQTISLLWGIRCDWSE